MEKLTNEAEVKTKEAKAASQKAITMTKALAEYYMSKKG